MSADSASATDDYKVVLPPIPSGAACLNSVLLHCDIKGRPYRIEDFRQELKRCAVLSDIVALGAFQMNHVWLATLRTPEAKERLLNAKELKVKGLRCVIIDPSTTEVRVRLHWLPFHVPDDAVRRLLEPYGKVADVGREKWRVAGFEGVESTTRVARVSLRSGVTPDSIPHQLRLYGASVLVVIPGRAPVCLRCKRSGHIRRDCHVPKCSECFRFGHEKEECVKTYARVTGDAPAEDLSPLTMDVEEAERTAHGLEHGAPSAVEHQVHPAEAKGAAEAQAVENANESVTATKDGVTPLPAVALPEDNEVPRTACAPSTDEQASEETSAMDDASESNKRGLDEPLLAPGRTPSPSAWWEKKRGRFHPEPNLPPDDGRRRDSK